MIRTQRLLSDSQRLLEERLGLLILSLVLVEQCQVVEALGCVGMIKTQRLLSDSQRLLKEQFGLLIERLVSQVRSCLIEEPGCFWQCKGIAIDEGCTCECMGKVAFALWPRFHLYPGKGLIDALYRSLSPLTLCLALETRFDDGLNKTMHREGIVIGIAADERIAAKHGNRLVEEGEGLGNGSQGWAKIAGPSCNHFQRNGIRRQEGTETQEVSCHGIEVFDIVKGEGPGRGNGFAVFCARVATSFEQVEVSSLILLE